VCRALSTSSARLVRPARLAETAAYLALLPRVQLILLQRERDRWMAVPARRGDRRLRIEGPVDLLLPEDGLERFETVDARCDGRLFFHERRDPRRDPGIAAYLRAQLAQRGADGLPPQSATLARSGLTPEERDAYAWARDAVVEAERDSTELRLERALAHAGARFRSYAERDDSYVVTYDVDGSTHVSSVRREDLTVTTAGICLAGQDRRFDLASLVGVLREARRGGGLDDEW
jgi:hypothetical protein